MGTKEEANTGEIEKETLRVTSLERYNIQL